MNIYEFAQMLNGREYMNELSNSEEKQAVELGFVVVFGFSDDNTEFRGMIHEEVGCYGDREIYLDDVGLFEECECECKHSEAAKEKCKVIEAKWDAEGYSWIYKTDIPHATFEIMDDGEKYCRGIVFDVKELEEKL
jgi:hypothetical protein